MYLFFKKKYFFSIFAVFKMANPVLNQSPNAAINKTLLSRYLAIPQPDDKVQAMYVWIDGSGEYVRAKTRTLNFVPKSPSGMYPCTMFDLFGVIRFYVKREK